MSDFDLEDLSRPFDPQYLEWRIQQSGISGGNPWAMVLAYVTNRAIQMRLDDVVGPAKWKNEYKPDGDGFLCGLSIKIDDEWITKWDGAEKTSIEPMKGGLSNSMKRAAVQWGIGRYLYNLEVVFAVCKTVNSRRDSKNNYVSMKGDGKSRVGVDWETPNVPMWALPGVSAEEYLQAIDDSGDIATLKHAYKEAYQYANSFGRDDLVKQYTDAKDYVKNRIDEVAKTEIKNNYSVASNWLDSQIESLHLIPNESSVKQVHGTLKAQLADKCEGQYFNVDELTTRLSTAISERIKQIGGQE
ncbi:MAG: hypothetical protein KAT62_03520 [Desulfuromonadales bacterium]|nr:hypothetical protein [Desulfuromonadales bacterium]